MLKIRRVADKFLAFPISPTFVLIILLSGRLCGLVGTVPGYRSRGAGSTPVATRFSDK
jgi:hypothetical protein